MAKGKIVVTIEGANIDEEMSKMKKIEQIPHVICADMMMAYSGFVIKLLTPRLMSFTKYSLSLCAEVTRIGCCG